MIGDLIRAYRQAFRLYMRTRTRPYTIEEAEEKRLFWAKAYACVAFLCMVSCTVYSHTRGINFSYDPNLPKEKAVVEKLSDSPQKVSVYKGFKKVSEFDYTPKSQSVSSSE